MNTRNSLLIILLTFSLSVSAQTEKGNIVFGGESNLNANILGSGNGNGDFGNSTVDFNLAPHIAVFVVDKLAIGAELQLGVGVFGTDRYTVTTFQFAAMPFIKYYFSTGIVRPFINAGIGGGIDTYRVDFDDSFFANETNKTKILVFDIGGGVSFFLNETVAIDLGLAFGYNSVEYDDEYNSDSKERGLALDIGFSVFL